MHASALGKKNKCKKILPYFFRSRDSESGIIIEGEDKEDKRWERDCFMKVVKERSQSVTINEMRVKRWKFNEIDRE